MSKADEMVNRLVSSFRDDIDSNLYKLLHASSGESLSNIDETIDEVQQQTNYRTAEGEHLAKILELVGIDYTGTDTTSKRRLLYRMSIAQSISDGTADNFIRVMSSILDTSTDRIQVREQGGGYVSTYLFMSDIDDSDLSLDGTVEVVESLTPVGIDVNVGIAGTFTHREIDEVSNPEYAYSGVEDEYGGTYAGYL